MDISELLQCYNSMQQYEETFNLFTNNESKELTEEDIVRSISMLMATFFMSEKEKFISKGENVTYSSIIPDDVLIDSMKIILPFDGTKVLVKNYAIDSIPEFIAKVRNKFIHGAYSIDISQKTIKMDMEIKSNGVTQMVNVELDIMKFTKFIVSIEPELILQETSRDVVMNLIPNNVRNEYDARKLLDNIEFKKIMLKDESPSRDQLKKFHDIISRINRNNATEGQIKQALKNEQIEYEILTNKLNDNDKEEAMQYYPFFKSGEAFKNYAANIYRKIETSKDYTEFLSRGVYLSILVLYRMLEQNSSTIKESNFSPKEYSLVSNYIEEIYLTNSIAKFYSLYVIPIDTIYGYKFKIQEERKDLLDYSILNLNNLNPNIMNIDDSCLKKYIDKVLVSAKDYNKIPHTVYRNFKVYFKNYKSVAKYKLKYTLAINKNKKQEQLRKLENAKNGLKHVKKFVVSEQIKLMKNKYKAYRNSNDNLIEILSDFENNKSYYQNKAIVKGIRDAICHGGVEYIFGLDGLYLRFNSLHEDKLEFQLTINFDDFSKIFFNEQPELFEFLNEKINAKKLTR